MKEKNNVRLAVVKHKSIQFSTKKCSGEEQTNSQTLQQQRTEIGFRRFRSNNS